MRVVARRQAFRRRSFCTASSAPYFAGSPLADRIADRSDAELMDNLRAKGRFVLLNRRVCALVRCYLGVLLTFIVFAQRAKDFDDGGRTEKAEADG